MSCDELEESRVELSFAVASELREAGVVTEASVGRTEYETEGRDFAPRTLPSVASLFELAADRGGGDVYEDVDAVRGNVFVDRNLDLYDVDGALECPAVFVIGPFTSDSSRSSGGRSST